MDTQLPIDTDIIAEVLQGNRQAYAKLVTHYQNYVFTIALHYTNNREDSEEIAQDVFVKVYRNLADFKGNSKFSTWLYAITVNNCLSFLRKRKIPVRSLDNFNNNHEPGEMNNTNITEQRSKAAIIAQSIQSLSPEDAQIITLFYKAEQTLEEISRILGIEVNTVKVRLHRARQRLKEKMEKLFGSELNDIRYKLG